MKWLLFMTLTLAFYFMFVLATARRRAMQDRIITAMPDQQHRNTSPSGNSPLLRQRLRSGLEVPIQRWVQIHKGKTWDGIQAKLLQAGSPGGFTLGEWIGFRLLTVALCVGSGIVFAMMVGGLRGLLLFFSLGLLGWIGPDFWLSRKARERQLEISKILPSALDLLTVSVEAGLGFDQALARISAKLHGPLADEFERTMREIQLGSSRVVALQRLALRSGVDGLRSFVSAIIQADKLGIGLAQVLRIQSASLRERRRLEAQERAMKAPVKMLFPLVLFVFPAVFIVILGPALIHVIQLFSHGGF